MKALASCCLLIVVFAGCSETPAPERMTGQDRQLAGLLDDRTHTLYVRVGWADTLLALIGAREETAGKRYSADVKGRGVQFTVVPVVAPEVYSPEQFGWFDTTKAYLCKFYFDAECGQAHPGFVAPCMATFGPHRAFGNSMTWTVNTWKSCTRGTSWCVEVWKQVGTITYYPGPNCADTIFATRPIMAFRCD